MPQREKQKTGYDVDVLKKAEEAVDTGHRVPLLDEIGYLPMNGGKSRTR